MWNKERFNVRFLLAVVLSIVFLMQSNIAFAWPWTSKKAEVEAQERKANWDNMTDEEKAARKTRMQERKTNRHSMTGEEKAARKTRIQERKANRGSKSRRGGRRLSE